MDFVKILNQEKNEIISHLKEDENNKLLMSTFKEGDLMFGIYLSYTDENYYSTIGDFSIENRNSADTLVKFVKPANEKVKLQKALACIKLSAIYMAAEKLKVYGLRHNSMIWLLSQPNPNKIMCNINWFGIWRESENQINNKKYSQPINIKHSKKLKELFEQNKFEEMKTLHESFLSRADLKDIKGNNIEKNESRRFNILQDIIQSEEIELKVLEDEEKFISYDINFKDKVIYEKTTFRNKGEEKVPDAHKIELTEQVFTKIMNTYEQFMTKKAKMSKLIKELDIKDKILEQNENNIIKQILIEDGIPVMYTLNCYESKHLNLGECNCEDHNVYITKELTEIELKDIYGRNREEVLIVQDADRDNPGETISNTSVLCEK